MAIDQTKSTQTAAFSDKKTEMMVTVVTGSTPQYTSYTAVRRCYSYCCGHNQQFITYHFNFFIGTVLHSVYLGLGSPRHLSQLNLFNPFELKCLVPPLRLKVE